MKYIIVSSDDAGELERLVTEEIDKGYLPIGGIAIDSTEQSFEIYQTMIDRSEEDAAEVSALKKIANGI